jgi:hypothetical protein
MGRRFSVRQYGLLFPVYTVAQHRSRTKVCSARLFDVQVYRPPSGKKANRRFRAMTLRGFHIVLALILVGCVLCPYVEFALDFNQSIFETGHDTESTIAIIALLLILAFLIASLIAHFIPASTAVESLVHSRLTLIGSALDFTSAAPEVSPPPLLPLRI